MVCEWCGKESKSLSRVARTLYEDTEFETTSFFIECESCFLSSTDEVCRIAAEKNEKELKLKRN